MVENMIDLKLLPRLPGVYLFKNSHGQIIYIGKAKSIRARVSSYFNKHNADQKVQALIGEYSFVEHIVTHTEIEAMILEAQLIQDYKPKFNILLKAGQPFVYILFTKGVMPKIKFVRNKNLKGTYIGPFMHKRQAKKVFEYLIETFRLSICNKKIENGCLDYHLGRCAGSCKRDFDLQAYIFRLSLAQNALKNNHKKLLKDLNVQIQEHNKNLAFEKSKYLQQYIDNLDIILHTISAKFRENKFESEVFNAVTPIGKIYNFAEDIDKKLQYFLRLKKPIRSIDCFDISHFQSNHLVGSCVRFTEGKPDKNKFRKFKIKTLIEQNDCAALQEIVSRRYKYKEDLPDLVLIDGGKGQLNAVTEKLSGVDCISLAKREETIFSRHFPKGIKLDIKDDVARLLIALRDYAHHFAVSYHRKKRSKELTR